MITVGIDPGWASFGIAISKDGEVLEKTSFVPKSFGSSSLPFIKILIDEWLSPILKDVDDKVGVVYIERFVTYAGMKVDGENILMLIGALEYFFQSHGCVVKLVKALDWKVKLCQHLVKTKKVSNPSTSLDKKFSIWAANQMSGLTFKSDHEADAVCISLLTDAIMKGK